ncbi:MAG: hypothetical protein Q9171_003194 [Xanthocarpia ochracea]
MFSKLEQPRKLFEYSPLGAGEIRLLRLRGTADPSGIVVGDLITVNLLTLDDDDTVNLFAYEALSYVWGNEPATCQIQLDDRQFAIRPNLEWALRVLGKPLVKPQLQKLLWIDAICINQTDSAEKNQQVQMMQLIYRQAQGLIIWMNSSGMTGDHRRRHTDADIANGLKVFARAHRAGRDTMWLARFLEDPCSRKKFVDISPKRLFRSTGNVDSAKRGGFWSDLVKFFDQDWWRRVWVRQEIAMSQRATVYCGESVIDWEVVAAVSHWVKLFTTDLDEKTREMGGKHRSGACSGEDMQYFRQTLQRKGYLDFQQMLVHARDCEATNPRDKVFAILGMVRHHGDMPVDYNLTPAEVAKLAFRKLAILNHGLDALIFSQNPECKEEIPSWAPNLFSGFDAQPSRLIGLTSSLYRAGLYPDGTTLSTNAIIFDSIKELSCPYSAHRDSKGWRDSMHSIRMLTFQWLGNMRTERKYEHLMRTLTRDRDVRGRRLMSNADGVDWERFFRIEHTGVGAATEFQYLSRAIRQFQAPTDENAEVLAWLRLYRESLGNRRVIMTERRRLGLVPAETRLSDVVCIIDGVDVPLVLRKNDSGTYVLIGEAYIHGVMDGEILVPMDGKIVFAAKHAETQRVDLV